MNTELELSRLSELEGVIERGQQTFIEVGLALAEIKNTRLYREGFATFEDYCRERWGWQRQHAYRLMDAAQAVAEMSPIGDKAETQAVVVTRLPPVQNEAQARELAKIPDPEIRGMVWQQANTMAEKIQTKVTAKLVREANNTLQSIREYEENPYVPEPQKVEVITERPHFPSQYSMDLWATLCDLENNYIQPHADLSELVTDLYDVQREDVRRIAPRLTAWFGGLR